MKNKKIFSLTIALTIGALLASPAFAQNKNSTKINQQLTDIDFHEAEYNKINKELALYQIEENATKEAEYLNIQLLKSSIIEDLLNLTQKQLEDITTLAANSIKADKISPQEQYNLLTLCIVDNELEILEALLKAGFSTTISDSINKDKEQFITLFTQSLISKNQPAFDLLYKYTPNNKRQDALYKTTKELFEINALK